MPKAGSGWSGRKIWSRTKRFRPPLLTRELGWVGRWEVWSDCDNVIMSTFCAWIICDGQLMVIFAWRPRGAQWNGERGWWWDLMMLLALWHFGVRAGSAGWPFDYTLYIYCTLECGPGQGRVETRGSNPTARINDAYMMLGLLDVGWGGEQNEHRLMDDRPEPTTVTRPTPPARHRTGGSFGILKIAEMLWYLCQYVVTIIYCNQ